MLNELVRLRDAMQSSGFVVEPRHPDVKALGKGTALRLRLDPDGGIDAIGVIDSDVLPRLWTMREGQHNSFPFLHIKQPLLNIPNDQEWLIVQEAAWKALSKASERRRALMGLVQQFGPRDLAGKWPSDGLMKSLERRYASLRDAADVAATRAAIERFRAAVARPGGFGPALLAALCEEAEAGDSSTIDLVHTAFVTGPTLYIDVPTSFGAPDGRASAGVGGEMAAVSRALLADAGSPAKTGFCALTGQDVPLLRGNFPQPNLPVLGQTFLFAKNADIPAAGRYGVYAAEAFPAGRDLVASLAGTIVALTTPDRQDKTWRSIPSEKAKQSDLLLAFLDKVPEAKVAEAVAGPPPAADPQGIADFETMARHVLDAVKTKIADNWRSQPLDLFVLRQVDPANRKVIHRRRLTAVDLYDSARAWQRALNEAPAHLRISIPTKKGSEPARLRPQRLYPLAIPRLTRVAYVQGGARRVDVAGVGAGDALALLLDRRAADARRILRLLLPRVRPLLAGIAHAARRSLADLDAYDRRAALELTALVIVLRDIIASDGGTPVYGTGYKLGQFLAAMDRVHAGYCITERGGEIPPTLLGNSVFVTAQTQPDKAMAMLCRRWKPYGSWAQRQWFRGRPELSKPLDGAKKERTSQEWTLINALWAARQFAKLSAELRTALDAEKPHIDDAFRADLLLGYLAGPVRTTDSAVNESGLEKGDEGERE